MALNHLPHITNVQAGVNKWDPVYKAMFEVYLSFPEVLGITDEDVTILSQQVTKVSGLDALQRMPQSATQKFFGVDVSYLKPVLDSTRATFSITFNLNLRNVTDNYVLKAFKKWGALSYDLSTGTRTLKQHYCAASIRIAEANRDGSVWRAYVFYDVMIEGIEGLQDLDYSSSEAVPLTVKFVSDYWDEDLA